MSDRAKLGKRPAAPRVTDFRWRAFSAAVQLPDVPSRFGHGNLFHGDRWQMLGNGPDDTVRAGFDGCGDCVWAGAAHEHRMLHEVLHRTDVPFTGADVVSDYSAATGYRIGHPETDQGTDVHEALAYRRKTGIRDHVGHRHRIGAYVALDPKNWDELREAVYIFGAVGIGFEFPAYAWDQFDRGQVWDVPADGGDAVEGGHYVPVVGAPSANAVAVVTWGRRQAMTRAFYERWNDESWTFVTPEELRTDGTGLHGFDVAELNAYLAELARP